MAADLDQEESRRLAALARLHVLDTPDEEPFDRITRLAAQLFATPVAAIGFVDDGREWFKSRVGFALREVPRDLSPCNLALERGEVTVVPDARANPRVAGGPLVRGPPHLRFYAGAPLRTADGRIVGILWVGDRRPRPGLSAAETDRLADLAAVAMEAVEQRLLNAAVEAERRALAEHRRLAELIVDGSAEGIFAVDREACCTIWNRAMAGLTGVPAEEVLGRNLFAIRWPLESGRPAEALRSALAGKAKALRDEAYRNRAGEERFFAVHFSPLGDAEGKPIGAIGFVRDTTQRHELEDRLRQMQKLDAIGQLTGTVAHDFNNLLTVIIGNLDRALPRVEGDPRLARLLQDTAAAAARGEKLTQQLLAFARRQRLQPQPVDANDLVAQMSDMLKRTLPETIELKLDLSPRLPRAAADPHQLEMALLNLALNAQAAMPGGGRLTIETASRPLTRAQLGANEAARPGRFVMIGVRDTGSGMSAQVKRRAFEPFFTTKPRGAGTGLGLSQVYGFAMQSLGHVRIDSRVGRGTAVELYLPTAAAEAERRTPPGPEHAAGGSGRTVLVVEDSSDVRAFAKAVLEEHGHRILEAADAEEALRRMRNHPEVDLVFTDVVIPGRRSGLDLARDLRRTRPDLPVVLTTGYTESLHDIEREGFALLLKPYRAGQLTRTLEQVASAKPAAEARATATRT